jgi:hypothetical protein
MFINYKNTLAVALFIGTFASQAMADTAPAAIDFHKTVLPILKSSCFACHVAGADKPYTSKDPAIEKKIQNAVSDGLDALTMGDKFPFPSEQSPGKQLHHLEKVLTKGFMPPESQAKYGIGQPLSDKDRKVLLKWVAQVQKSAQ